MQFFLFIHPYIYSVRGRTEIIQNKTCFKIYNILLKCMISKIYLNRIQSTFNLRKQRVTITKQITLQIKCKKKKTFVTKHLNRKSQENRCEQKKITYYTILYH